MSYISFYRKYRPKLFEEIVGQNHITQTLSNAIKQGRISHAYLFAGPHGTGKTTTARVLTKAINCEKGPTPTPCNKCSICEAINNDRCVDVIEIDAASHTGVDNVRELRDKVRLATAQARKKVYIIDEVHMLSTGAFNALLKMLEEPPAHVIFILATTEPHKVLPTILSRCQRFDFRRILATDIADSLLKIAQAEKIKIDRTVLPLIAKHAQGSLRDGIGTLDQLSSFATVSSKQAGKEIKIDDVAALLGFVDTESLFKAVDILTKKDTGEALIFVERLVESSWDLRQFVKDLTEHLRNLFIIQNTTEPAEIVNTTPEIFSHLQDQASQIGPVNLRRWIDILGQVAGEMRWDSNSRLLLEMALVKMTRAEADFSWEGVLARVEELEKKLTTPKPPVTSMASPESSKKAVPKKKLSQKSTQEKVSSKPTGSPVKDEAEEKKKVPPETGKLLAKEKGQGEKAERVDIEKIKRIWPLILKKAKEKKISLYALLLEAKPAEQKEDTLILHFHQEAAFHKKEVEKEQNLELAEKAVKEVLGVPIKINCVLMEDEGSSLLEEEKRAQKKEQAGKGEEERKSALDLLKENLAAEVIEESETDQ